jgi:tripartite-type tricarboxylate transporter receptor subunit TctC
MKCFIASVLPAVAFGLASIISPQLQAQDYPSKPITLVHGFATGGQTDLSVRRMAELLSKALNTPVVVNARPGAAQTIAGAHLAQAPADGYTIGHFYQGAFSTTPLIQPINYKTEDLVPVIAWQMAPQMLVVRADSPWRTLSDLVAAAKSSPGIGFGHQGKGSVSFMAPTVFAGVAQISLTDVQFKGDSDLITSLLGGHIPLASLTEVAAAPLIESGRARALVTYAKQRTTASPSVPTFEQQGFEVPIQVPIGILFVPRGTPAPIAQRLHDTVKRLIEDPAVQADFAKMKQALYYMDGPSAAKMIVAERATYAPILKAAGLAR